MTVLDSDSYSATFGGQNRAPAQIDYVAYEIATDIHTQWPFLAEDGAFIAPAKIDISATVANLKVFMPDASIASVGQDALVRNVGLHTIGVVDFNGNTIVAIESGQQWLIWIVDDDTSSGLWARVQFGAGSSSVSAGALAGAGLRAEVTRLDQDLITTPLLGNHFLSLGDRARVLQSNGGVVGWTTEDANVLLNGWFCYVVNSGSGTLTLDPFGSQTIDGAGTKVFAPGESAIVFCDGSNFITLGYGRSLVSTVSGTSISLAPGGTINLTPSQIASQVQNWTGTLTSDAILDYGGGVGYWFVWNNTIGAFDVTARNDSLDPGVVIPQGNFSIIRSDGSNMNIAFTATSGTVTEVRTQAGETVGGPITSVGTIGLADTPVTPGTYGLAGTPGATTTAAQMPIVTIDQKGREIAASSYTLGTAANFNAGIGPGQIPVIGLDGNLPSILGGVPTGAIIDYMLATLPAGYVWGVGTVGDVGSGATYASLACKALFEGIWASYPNTTAPVTPGGRGVSALQDWIDKKVIAVTDFRGRARVGRDALGSFGAAGRMTAQASPNGTTPGAAGGVETTYVYTSVSVSGSISGGTAGGQTVRVYGNTGPSSNNYSRGDQGSHSPVPNDFHSHWFDGTFGTNGESLGVSGTFSGSGGGNSSWIPTMVPFAICNVIIKL
jgi:hypothetical protein